jgi:uncharacterized protein
VTHLDSALLAGDTGSARPGAGPTIPTASATTAHRPLAGPGAELTAGLLHDWQRRNRDASLPLALRQLEAAGNLGNVRLAAKANESRDGGDGDRPDASPASEVAQVNPDAAGPAPRAAAAEHGYRGPVFMDSDLYKTLEAIGWELARRPAGNGAGRGELAGFAAEAVALLEQAQQSDGYLDSYIQVSGEPRYGRLSSSHEMYCAGHLIQAAVALHRGTGNEQIAGRLLAVARKLAGHLVGTFLGREAGLDGHPVIETALAELYRETGHRPYLELATQFVSQRGHGLAGDSGRGSRYLQDFLPVRQAVTEQGHAVRALYLEAGVADVATETGDAELLACSVARWEDMAATKTYLTGGNGSRHADEAFGDRFELPPDRAYNETCAAIASFQWSWRLLLATGQARYAELMERVLYNAFGAAISTDGTRFFYVNPLQRRHDHTEGDDAGRRHEWFSCACCPPNIMRLLASLHHYLATTAGDTLYLHQFTGTQITAPLAGGTLALSVSTGYPWSGQVSVRVDSAPPGPCGLAFRVPSWAPDPHVTVNGQTIEAGPDQAGYLVTTRTWHSGDVLAFAFGMTPRLTYPHPRIDAVRGCAALERGPLVYCFEQADQPPGTDLGQTALLGTPHLRERETTLPGVGHTVLIDADATRTAAARPASWPYLPQPGESADGEAVTVTAIPYFQWDNRDGRGMRVWLPRTPATDRSMPCVHISTATSADVHSANRPPAGGMRTRSGGCGRLPRSAAEYRDVERADVIIAHRLHELVDGQVAVVVHVDLAERLLCLRCVRSDRPQPAREAFRGHRTLGIAIEELCDGADGIPEHITGVSVVRVDDMAVDDLLELTEGKRAGACPGLPREVIPHFLVGGNDRLRSSRRAGLTQRLQDAPRWRLPLLPLKVTIRIDIQRLEMPL